MIDEQSSGFLSVKMPPYPSARADVKVEVQEGKLVGSSGWRLVDFRRSTSPTQKLWLVGAPDSWRYLHDRVCIKIEKRDKTKNGSWALVGNAIAHRVYRKLVTSGGGPLRFDEPREIASPTPTMDLSQTAIEWLMLSASMALILRCRVSR